MLWFLLFLALFCILSYHRAALSVWTLSLSILLLFFFRFENTTTLVKTGVGFLFLVILVPLLIEPWRRRWISQPLLNFYLKAMPSMSRTEKEALAAGTVTWEGNLFRGNPDWNTLLTLPKPKLSPEEQAFIDGPVETLCSMLDDWDVTHRRADLSPELWKFIREQGFFGLIIPKEYGGKAFSAYAHSQILIKVFGHSGTVATTIGVPNSLGPGELIMHYGTQEQKSYYLPRLARGEEIPCFALTGPSAGSDASAIPDRGVVCWGKHNGKKTLGILLNFDKRYITLAPVATVIGLAFKLDDPDHLLGNKKHLGITCALIPRGTPNITIGRRHYPLNIPFQNGPIQGKDVFIPMEWIIGGPNMAGRGWQMLMECLATGRAITLPASSAGGTKMLAYASGAYARIRRQFNMPIGRFEGVEEAITRIVSYAYVIDAARSFAAAAIDAGEKPAIASAIIKYHTTELARIVANDAMDLHGGKGICLGPKNYIGRGYQAVPIAITVEGANILTRNMIIFGQGAMRCHPYIYPEFVAAQLTNKNERLVEFDKAIMGHISYSISNIFRTFILSITQAFLVRVPTRKGKRFFQKLTYLSSAFALLSDVSLIVFGGALKRKESISARLGDILSYLYLLSAVLKYYYDHNQPQDDFFLVKWCCQTYLYKIQQKIDELLQNFPNRWVAGFLRIIIFPFGKNLMPPSDKLGHKVTQLFLSPTETRARLAQGIYLTATKQNFLFSIQDALIKTIAAEPVEKLIKTATSQKLIEGNTILELARQAIKQNIISIEQYDILLKAEEARQIIIAVDDFDADELTASFQKIDAAANQ